MEEIISRPEPCRKSIPPQLDRVRRYHGDRKVKTFPCAEWLRVLAFAQLTYRDS